MNNLNRTTLTEQEKFALDVAKMNGLSGDLSVNNQDLNVIVEREARAKFNDEVDKFNESTIDYEQKIHEANERLSKDMNNIECKPLFQYIHVVPYDTNPFQKLEKKGNLIIPTYEPTHFSNETGKEEKDQPYIIVADVVEVGPEVKFVKPGDVVMYLRVNELPVPLYNTGIKCVGERSVIAVINEGLSERFKNITNN